MFVKINSVFHVNTETVRLIWDMEDMELRFSIYSESTDRTEKVKGYSFEDFKTLYTYYKQKNVDFMDLTIPRESHVRACSTCGGLGRAPYSPLNDPGSSGDCYSCKGKGTFRLLL